MGEKKDVGSPESKNLKAEARQRVINTFSQNFGKFLDDESNILRLININFEGGGGELLVKHFDGNNPIPFEYGSLNNEFEKVFNRYIKSGSIPTKLKDEFVLEKFDDMPKALDDLVGKPVTTSIVVYDLVSFDDENALVASVRYALTGNEANPVAEIWTGERYKSNDLPPGRRTQTGKALVVA